MNKMMFAIVMLFALLFSGCAGIFPQEPVACTMEAKICPDGSAVGRVGPNCEFAPCPGEDGGVECGECPLLSQPAPTFCTKGTIVAGVPDECGCMSPPTCDCGNEDRGCMDGSKVKKTGPECEFAPCPAGVETQEGFLASNDWKPLEIDGAAVEAGRAYIKFDSEASEFTGNAGCNYIGGTYAINGDQISFGQTAITMMYCEGTVEDKVIGKINGGPYRWEIANNELNFYTGENLVMVWGIRG